MKTQYNIRLDKDLLERLKVRAQKEGTTVTSLILDSVKDEAYLPKEISSIEKWGKDEIILLDQNDYTWIIEDVTTFQDLVIDTMTEFEKADLYELDSDFNKYDTNWDLTHTLDEIIKYEKEQFLTLAKFENYEN